MRVLTVFLIAIFVSGIVYAQNTPDPGGYDRVLLPVYLSTEQHGAYGSVWATELTVRNDGTAPVQVFQNYCSFFCSCGVITQCFERALEPAKRLDNSLYLSNGFFFPYSPGIFMYTQRSGTANVTIGLRVSDVSREGISAGTELPVVREDEFRTSSVRLINVPFDSRSRTHLRIYSAPMEGQAKEAVVRVFELDDTVPLAEQHVFLLAPEEVLGLDVPQEMQPFPAHPAYAEISSVGDLTPLIRTLGRARIEIVPVSAGLRLWAFVCVTNNESQQVTTVTPQ